MNLLWTNFENRSIFGEVMDNIIVDCFFDLQCIKVLKEFSSFYQKMFEPDTPKRDRQFANRVKDEKCKDCNMTQVPFIDIDFLLGCMQSLKLHKAAGHDSMSNEHIIYSGNCLVVLMCFYLMPCLNRFAVLETVDSVEGTWSNFRNTVVQAAEKVVGYRRGTRRAVDQSWHVEGYRRKEKDQATEVTAAANKRAACRPRRGQQQCGQSQWGHEQLVPGDNRCSTRLQPTATAVCNNDRLGTQEEHRKKCRWHHVNRRCTLVQFGFCRWYCTHW